MANLQVGTDYGGYLIKKAFYWYATGTGGEYYLHLKTNQTVGNYIMGTIEAEGYNYGAGLPIKSAWCFYSPGWDTGNLYSVGLKDYYTGISAHGVYRSSDNQYICLRAYSGNWYYAGLILNSYTQTPTGARDISILDVNLNTNSGVYF